MNNTIKRDIATIIIISIIATIILGFISIGVHSIFFPQRQETEGFGGYCPIKIYQIYDRDTGVYYAVTEKGGICVMQTAEGKVKLVDGGDGGNAQ